MLTVPFALLPSKPTPAELVYLLKKLMSGAPAVRLRVFSHSSLIKQAHEAANQAGVPADCIYQLDSRPHTKITDLSSVIQNVKAKKIPRQPVIPAQKDTLAYLLFSSGTSGPPKGVRKC